jgi:hypothetical protein
MFHSFENKLLFYSIQYTSLTIALPLRINERKRIVPLYGQRVYTHWPLEQVQIAALLLSTKPQSHTYWLQESPENGYGHLHWLVVRLIWVHTPPFAQGELHTAMKEVSTVEHVSQKKGGHTSVAVRPSPSTLTLAATSRSD